MISMKKHINTFRYILLFITLICINTFIFKGTILNMESSSFFSTAPDFKELQLNLPYDIIEYISCYISQYYKYDYVGAFIHALLIISVLIILQETTKLFTHKQYIIACSEIPGIVMIFFAYKENGLIYSTYFVVLSLIAGIILYCIHLMLNKNKHEKHTSHKYYYLIITNVIWIASIFSIVNSKEYQKKELAHILDRYSLTNEWDNIIEKCSKQGNLNTLSIRYLYLAMNVKGNIGDNLFRFPVSSQDDFYFGHNDNITFRNFNTALYKELNIDNEVIHNAYQAGILSRYGMSFRSLRILTDTSIKMKDTDLARKYIDILSTSSCHDQFIKNRIPAITILENEKENKIITIDKKGVPFFIGAREFVNDMARIIDKDRGNIIAINYLLCSLLVEKRIDIFEKTFEYCYDAILKKYKRIPDNYQEALIMLGAKFPDILSKYNLSEEKINDFKTFMSYHSINNTKSREFLKYKFKDTFWYYYSF